MPVASVQQDKQDRRHMEEERREGSKTKEMVRNWSVVLTLSHPQEISWCLIKELSLSLGTL